MGGKGPNDPKARRYGFPAYQDEADDDFKLAGDVKQTAIDALNLKQDQSFGYWFDFGDDWWQQINVVVIEKKTSKGRYPKIIKKVGKVPRNIRILMSKKLSTCAWQMIRIELRKKENSQYLKFVQHDNPASLVGKYQIIKKIGVSSKAALDG
ncbi:MAG: hypothetical protein IPL17_05525 [Anaerolineales bacterium]|nr:hypothetical protein [Anaerolineales bacterium]